jgi:MFS transporter, ACS family, glucarate transporter
MSQMPMSPSSPEGDHRRIPQARRALLIFAVTLAAILYLHRVCIAQSQSYMSADLGLTKKQMGLAMTVFGVAYGLFEIPCGWLSDRLGPRRVLTWVECK